MAPRQKEGGNFIKNWTLTVILAVVLAILSVLSLFVGVIDIQLAALLAGDLEQLEIFLISRLPRLLAILCTGVGMSVAGLIMQQLCMNKFVSPTTGATIWGDLMPETFLGLPMSNEWIYSLLYNGITVGASAVVTVVVCVVLYQIGSVRKYLLGEDIPQ